MQINADFSKRVLVNAADLAWAASPMPGVDRRMLDRIGAEVARATSVVRYQPGSHFSPHVHDGGEEFLVLEGVFQDEHGDFPAGAYIRNPPTSRHTPGSEEGCTILVKLWQFDLADRSHVRIDTGKIGAVPDRDRPGVAVTPLFKDSREDVRIETWEPGAVVILDAADGLELFVLAGGLEEGGDSLREQSWLRLPPDSRSAATAGPEGARLWVKSGHLREVSAPGRD